MTAADYLARVEALDKAAQRGPWEVSYANTYSPAIETASGDYVGGTDEPDDAGLTAAYRTAAPTMAAALRAVLDLHRPDMFGNCTNCEVGPGWSMTHPCKTLEIIEKFLGDHDAQE